MQRRMIDVSMCVCTTETDNKGKKSKKGEYKLDQNSKCIARNDLGKQFAFCVTGKSINHPEGNISHKV